MSDMTAFFGVNMTILAWCGVLVGYFGVRAGARSFRLPTIRPPSSFTMIGTLAWGWWLVLCGLWLAWDPPLPTTWANRLAVCTLTLTGIWQITRFARVYALGLVDLSARRAQRKAAR